MKKNKKKKNKPNKIIRTYIQNVGNQVQTIHTFIEEPVVQDVKEIKYGYVKKQMSIHKDKKAFINEIKLLKKKEQLSEHSFEYLKELIIRLADKENSLTTPEQKMIELEIANRKIVDWQKARFDSKKENLKEKTKLKISTLFEDYDDYMWKGKLTSFSELRYLSKTLAKKI